MDVWLGFSKLGFPKLETCDKAAMNQVVIKKNILLGGTEVLLLECKFIILLELELAKDKKKYENPKQQIPSKSCKKLEL